MSTPSRRGFGPVLANRPFRALWIAQALAQTAQHAIHFVQMVLIEELTRSSTHIGLVILAFTLPGVLFSSVAGVMVDRWPKKYILVGSNALRVLLVGSYLLLLATTQGWWLLLGIYLITFISSAIGQFFAPAEAATIPLLVGESQLLTANSLFNLTLAISQVVGIIILGPLTTKLAGTRGAFIAIALMYAGATLFVTRLPRATLAVTRSTSPLGRWERAKADLREGWAFVMGQRRVLLAMSHLTLISAMIMIMAMLAPGFAARVLGKAPEDAVIVFAPAGVGMLLATGLLGRFGYRVRKDWLSNIGLVMLGFTFTALGLVSQGYRILPEPLLHLYPHAAFSLTAAVMGISLLMGLTMSSISILAQTILQESSPPTVRGRVFALQFMLNNLIGIPPMLTIGGLADWIGIPQVILGVGAVVFVASGISIYFTLSPARRRFLKELLHKVSVKASAIGRGAWHELILVRIWIRQVVRRWLRAWLVVYARFFRAPSRWGAATSNPSLAGKGSKGKRPAKKSLASAPEQPPEIEPEIEEEDIP